MPEPSPTWTITGVAKRLGISVPTLRSWDVRYGLSPTHRTVGGHRRYSVTDLARLQRVQQLIAAGTPTGSAARIVLERVFSPGGPPPEADAIAAFHNAIDELDQARISAHARRLLDDLGTESAWTSVFTPALQQTGTRWLSEDTGIACEHLLTTAVMGALSDHSARAQFARTDAPDVLLTATENELHTLPLYAAASGLAELGLTAFIAGSMPARTLLASTARLRPRSVFLWARSAETAAPKLLKDLVPLVPVVYAAGLGWSDATPDGITLVRDLPTALTLFAAHLGSDEQVRN